MQDQDSILGSLFGDILKKSKGPPMEEISSEIVGKIKAKQGGWFFLYKVIVRPDPDSNKVIEWWKVFRSNGAFEARFITHAPTKDLVLEQIAKLDQPQGNSHALLGFKLPPPTKAEISKAEQAAAKELTESMKCQAEKKAKKEAELAEKLARKEVRLAKKKQKKRFELYQKTKEIDRFIGIEI